ncbi:inorganic phosphate transporter [Chrysiogenes arsenatis]|uniref:inorganic phosphate transporter n=1 Tax=Chrysiogenes arsenatis TaxID=309797 RepID=UPI000402C989|nr:inorganic phosphate transporter [Chrysiogenes arsenatis]
MDSLVVIYSLAVAFGFYMAWNIGANDVANAMGTSVGSRSLTLRQVIIVAAIFEFLGAVLVGSSVTQTIQRGIVDINFFADSPEIFVYGMLAALLGAALWLQMATIVGWPVSTTHSIIGAVIGFGLIAGGPDVIQWNRIGQIVASWFVSPIAGLLISLVMFMFIQRTVFASESPVRQAKRVTPYLTFLVVVILCLSFTYKGLNNLGLYLTFVQAMVIAALLGLAAALFARNLVNKIPDDTLNRKGFGVKFTIVEKIFSYLQILTACYVAFAHGANDVANAIGPLAAIVTTVQTGILQTQVAVPFWVLVLGGSGIVLGVATMGYKVIETIGTKITLLTPSRGFAATFGAATTVLICSKMGLPISTTHTLVGSVIGVGLAGGIGSINMNVLKGIFLSWFITLPAAGLMSIVVFKVLTAIL